MQVNTNDTDWDELGRVVHDGVPYTGEIVETDKNGVLVGRRTLINGRQNGLEQRWHPSGALKAELVTDMGRVVGTAKEWHENGVLAFERIFDERGVLMTINQWDESGNPVERPRTNR